MRYTIATLTALACTLCAIACATLAASSLAAATPVSADASGVYGHATVTLPCPAEDDPAWNWSECGNHRRGIVDAWGNPRVVGPCEYVYRARHGMLSPGLRRMRGDRTARRVCGGAFPDTLREARLRDRGQEF